MTQGKGDKRRPMIIDDRQLDFNWSGTFQTPPEYTDKHPEINDMTGPDYRIHGYTK